MAREELLALTMDVDRLLAAGAAAAVSSERLHQRGQTLRELAPKVPALQPVADVLDRFFQSPADQAATPFLDLVLLARQLRGSLGSVGVAGELRPIPPDGAWQTDIPVRDLYPLHEALVGAAPDLLGRLRDGCDRQITRDLRLLSALVSGLDHGYAPPADLIAQEILPALGPKVVGVVLPQLNLGGSSGDARRLQLVCRLDRAAGHDLCRRALRDGSVTLRLRALQLLPDFDKAEAERLGLELCEDADTAVRCAALHALREARTDRVLDVVLTAAQDKNDAVFNAAMTTLAALPHPHTTPCLLGQLHHHLAALDRTAGTPREPSKPQAHLINRITRFVQVVTQRKDVHRAEAVWAVVPLLDHRDRTLQKNTYQALNASIPDALRVIMPVLRSVSRNDTLQLGVTGLDQLYPIDRAALFDVLFGLARDARAEARQRQEAVLLLPGFWKDHQKEILTFFRSLLREKDPDPDLEAAAFAALAELGPRARDLVPTFLHLMQTGHYYGPHFEPLADGLPRIDPEGRLAIPGLVDMLRSRRSHIVWQALRGLRSYGLQARHALPEVTDLLGHEDGSVRKEASACVTALGGQADPRPD